MQNIDSDLIRGNIDTIILKTMVDGDKYGLDIIKEVETRSNGTYELKQPTLYSCLKRLENQELISSYWLDSDIGGKRHYYKLTEKGKDTLKKKQEEWSKSKFIIDNLLSTFNYDEYRLVKKQDYDKIIEGKQFEFNPQSSQAETISDQTDSDTQFENETDSDDALTLTSSTTDDFDDEDENNSETTIEEDNFAIEDLNDSETVQESIDDEPEELETSHVYVSNESENLAQSNEEPVQETNELPDQSDKESNILSKLRSWNNEEINEYVGDKTSYLNHVNTNAVQQNILDLNYQDESATVDGKIDEFEAVIEELNNFSSEGETTKVDEPEEQSFELENIDFSESEQTEAVFESESNDNENVSENTDNDFLKELDELNSSNSNGFFSSNDSTNYFDYETKQNFDNSLNETYQSVIETENVSFEENENNDDLYNQYNYETEESDDEDDDIEYHTKFMTTDETDETEQVTEQKTDYYSDFDSIISKNATEYKTENSSINDAVYAPFKPSYTSENYKQKLSNLSVYSKVSTDDTEKNEVIEKTKDIASLKAEFEKEGIVIKQFKRDGNEDVEKSYLLVNKINLIRSLILFFGYVFVLSALYIILNNTSLREMQGFSIKYFLYGFIPFAIYLLYYLIQYLINPYKKVPAKYAPRIMLFISVIITVQLLLITYCVNLQLGFYSFTQSFYNHLIWIIPAIISFAPIFSNLIYITLFYSKNFNV